VGMFRAFLRHHPTADERGAGEGGALAAPEGNTQASRLGRPRAHSWPPQKQPWDCGRKEWVDHLRAALVARAVEERAGEPAAAAPATPAARLDSSSAPGTSPSSPSSRPPRQTLQPHRSTVPIARQPLQPHRSNVPIPRQPGDALLVERRANHRTRAERYAVRGRGKLQSPVDPNDADSLRALRIETEDVLASDRDQRRRRLRRRRNRFDR